MIPVDIQHVHLFNDQFNGCGLLHSLIFSVLGHIGLFDILVALILVSCPCLSELFKQEQNLEKM